MVEVIDESWEVSDARLATGGVNDSYFLTVETGAATRQCVLKLSNGRPKQIRAESRLLQLLDDNTDVPVPTVFGAVDAHSDLPAPFFLMKCLQGEHLSPEIRELPVEVLDSIAKQVGEYLADIHSVDAFDMFGDIRMPADTQSPTGACPLACEYSLTLDGPYQTWPAWLEEIAQKHLDHHQETRFRDLTPRIRSELQRRIPRLAGSFTPAVGRIDHAFENLLVDPENTTITGLIDWGILRTVDPEYDLTCAEQSFCGTLPLGADRRLQLKTALYEGYKNRREISLRDDCREVYLLVNQVARQNWLSDWVTDDIATPIERRHRQFLDNLL